MKSKMRCDFTGAFQPHDIGRDAWRLSRIGTKPLDVLLRGADPQAAELLRQPLNDVALEWSGEGAMLRLTSDGRQKILRARSAIVHEPLPQLYQALPLAVFDARAKRFWAWVFRLVRVPGGRYLLGVLARRGRERH
jgi:hypothetical protein